jgi:sugar O-acyltransferase (sialic acid O-acetyltransferase NeuD family)
MKPAVIIIGAGGHAKVVADALLCAGEQVLGFTDPDATKHGHRVLGLPVLGSDAVLAERSPEDTWLANGIGGIRGEPLRRQVQTALQQRGWRFIDVRHPSVVISPFAVIGAGAQLMAGCVVQAGARIGDGTIINTCAVIEHDVHVGDFAHIAPRAVVCGAADVGADSHVGAGAVLRQGVRLGDGTLVGAGAVVVKNAKAGSVIVGTPARPMEMKP